MIVVVPDGDTRYGCGQWVDSPVTGNFEQYVVHEVVAHVDGDYRTLPDAASRGVLGFSSGGFGAWNLASRNPGTFGALAMLSGDSFFDMTHKAFLYDYLTSIWPEAPRRAGGGEPGLRAGLRLLGRRTRPILATPRSSSTYRSPIPSGELIQEVWDRWLSFDPVVNWRDRLDDLRRLRGILLDAGTHDEHHLEWGHRLLSHHLDEAGIAHQLHREPRQPRWSIEGEDTDGVAVDGRGAEPRTADRSS